MKLMCMFQGHGSNASSRQLRPALNMQCTPWVLMHHIPALPDRYEMMVGQVDTYVNTQFCHTATKIDRVVKRRSVVLTRDGGRNNAIHWFSTMFRK
jgi:hypothetical protein